MSQPTFSRSVDVKTKAQSHMMSEDFSGESHLDVYLSLIVRLMKCAKGKSSMSPAPGAFKGSIPFSKRGADTHTHTHEGQM